MTINYWQKVSAIFSLYYSVSLWGDRTSDSVCDTTVPADEGANLLCKTAISDFNDAKQFCRWERFFPAGVDVRCNNSAISASLSSNDVSVEDVIDLGDVHRERDVDCRPEDDLAAFALKRFICSKLFFSAIFISCTWLRYEFLSSATKAMRPAAASKSFL